LSEFNQTLVRSEIQVTTDFENCTLITRIGANFDALDGVFFEKKQLFNSNYIFIKYDFRPSENLNLLVGVRFDNQSKYKSTLRLKIVSDYTITDCLKINFFVDNSFKIPNLRCFV
jgi:outer membrane receptor for ferrienterochelin and colicins